MRTLIISDIHGNDVALQAVLEAAAPFQAAVCLGDVVGYGPNPNECISTVQTLPSLITLAGNHDLGAAGRIDTAVFSAGAGQALAWTRRQLSANSAAYLQSVQPTGTAPFAFLAHASPRDPVWEYLDYVHQAEENFKLFEGTLCFVGHTHVPRVFEEAFDDQGGTGARDARIGTTLDLSDGTRRIVNPGSVGQPRDGDARAAYAVFDSDLGQLAFFRVEYDIERTAKRIENAGLPRSLASRLYVGM